MLPALILVDDDEEILEFLEGILGEKYTLFKAGNGKKALDILAEEAIQLVISDIKMPDMDGFMLCKAIKSNFELSHIPVILLTAKNTIQAKIEGLELGADAYIDKPFSTQHLQAQIANLLHNRSLIREYFANSSLVHIKSLAHSRVDERFLEQLNEAIQINIENEALDIDLLAKCLNMSRATLYRKIKAISDFTPAEFINIIRLKKAAALLAEGHYKIYEVALMVGFSSQSIFGRNFSKQFSMTPSAFMRSKIEDRGSII